MGTPSIWNCINSLGGKPRPGDAHGEGYNEAIGHALEIIEGYGLVEGCNVTFETAAEIGRLRSLLEEAERALANVRSHLQGLATWQESDANPLMVPGRRPEASEQTRAEMATIDGILTKLREG